MITDHPLVFQCVNVNVSVYGMNPLTFISIRVEGSFCSFMAMMVRFSHEMREEAKSLYSSIFNCRSYKYKRNAKLSNIPYYNLTAKESF